MEPTAAETTVVETETIVQGSPAPEPAARDPQVDVESLIAEKQKLEAKVQTLLGEKKKVTARMNDQDGKFQEMIQGLAKLAGLETDEPDPKALTQRMEDLQSEVTRQRIENRAIKAAYAKGVDPDLAVPVLQAKGALNVDLSDDGVEAALAAAMDNLVEQHPNLVASPREGTPKAVLPTPSGATPATTLEDRYQQVLAGGNSFEIADFMKEHGADLYREAPVAEVRTIV